MEKKSPKNLNPKKTLNKTNKNTITKSNTMPQKTTKNILKKSRSPMHRMANMLNLMSMGMERGFSSIFVNDLPMHRPGEIPDMTHPIQIKTKRTRINPRTQPVEFLQNFFAGFGIPFPPQNPNEPKYKYKQVQSRLGLNLNNNKKNIKKANTINSIINNNNINTSNNNQNNNNQNNNIQNNNIQNNNNQNRIRLNNIRRHNFTNEIYDQSFNQFGSSFDDEFRNNYSSNFRSNLDREAFDYLLSIIRGNRVLVSENKHPPTKPEVLKQLNKFDMCEKYCKKKENGEIEFPNCCICLADIILKQSSVLLPCGHLLHWKCGELWLKKQNTCPLCRFELPGGY